MSAILSLLFIVARFLLFPALVSGQAVTFKTVQDCVSYQYDLAVQSLCATSNQCDVNLCSPQYNSTDSYNNVLTHCEVLMQAPPSVVQPIMQATCLSKQGGSTSGNSKSSNTGLIVGAILGAIVGLVLIAFLATFVYHKSRRSIAFLASWGIRGATCPGSARHRGASGVYGVPNIAPSSSPSDPRKLSPLQLSTTSSFGIPASSSASSSFVSISHPADVERSQPSPNADIDMKQMRTPYYEAASTFSSTPSTPITPFTPMTPSSPTPLMLYPPSPSTHRDPLDYSPSRPKYWI